MRITRWWLAAAAFAMLAAPAPALAGGDDEPQNELGVLLGASHADKDLRGDETSIAPTFGLRFAHIFDGKWSWFADATYTKFKTDIMPDDPEVWTVRTGPEFFLSDDTHRARWFVAPSVGWMKASEPGDLDMSRAMVSLGVGQRILTRGLDHFIWQVRADQTLGSKGLVDGGKVLNVQALLGYAWGLGGHPKDTDGDGVPDFKDKCPGTPAGAKVDLNGCPIDSDGDGVFDGIDQCPNTPKGWPVDAKGCPIDSDKDGVPDGKDKCPNTPLGAKVDDNGCPLDSDGDGVYDGLDKCPGTPKGWPVDKVGCPLDSDGDGVPDGIDKCPGTPKGVKVDATGCPLPEPKPEMIPEKGQTLVLEGVYFDTDKATLKPESVETLDRVAASLKAFPAVRLEVAGHTDSRGAKAHNQKLSEARAKTVMDYLVGKGVDAGRLAAKGYGMDKPIAPNTTDEGRAKNRRVELSRLD